MESFEDFVQTPKRGFLKTYLKILFSQWKIGGIKFRPQNLDFPNQKKKNIVKFIFNQKCCFF